MKLLIISTVFFVIFFFGRLTMGYFVESVPIFEIFLTPLLWFSIITGVIMGVCVIFELIKKIKELISNGKDKE